MSKPATNGGANAAPVGPIVDTLEALGHDSPFERAQGAAADDPTAAHLTSAVGNLLAQLKDVDGPARLRAATALGAIGGAAHEVLPGLRAALQAAALHDADEAVRAAAVHGVLQVGPQASSQVAALTESLQDELDTVRFHAAIGLGDCGPAAQSASAALVHAVLWDRDPAVRVVAAGALWKIDNGHGPLVIPALTEALASDNELICWIAADCLGRIGPPAGEAVPALRQALVRPFQMAHLRRGVALALQRIDPQAAP
jgi:HEAT repeat protein